MLWGLVGGRWFGSGQPSSPSVSYRCARRLEDAVGALLRQTGAWEAPCAASFAWPCRAQGPGSCGRRSLETAPLRPAMISSCCHLLRPCRASSRIILALAASRSPPLGRPIAGCVDPRVMVRPPGVSATRGSRMRRPFHRGESGRAPARMRRNPGRRDPRDTSASGRTAVRRVSLVPGGSAVDVEADCHEVPKRRAPGRSPQSVGRR